jgi:hypothetical protein
MSEKDPNGVTNCPFPDTIVMFCAEAGWAQKSPTETAAKTITLNLFKITSSLDAGTRLAWDGRGENSSVPLLAAVREHDAKKKRGAGAPLSQTSS